MISTGRHIEYARGYLQLGLVADAARELALIPAAEHSTTDVLEALVELHMAAKAWELAASAAKQLVAAKPDDPGGWISWAYATRRYRDIGAAEIILLDAERALGVACSMIHYNLACYRCQQGDVEGAKRRLTTACAMDKVWKTAALEDADLVALQDFVRTL